MTTQTELPQMLPVVVEARPTSRPSAPMNEAKVISPAAYWGDRLALIFWLLCFGIMLAMNLIEALHRLVLFLMGGTPTT